MFPTRDLQQYMNTDFKIGDEVIVSQEGLDIIDKIEPEYDMTESYQITAKSGDQYHINGWWLTPNYLIKHNRNVLHENIN